MSEADPGSYAAMWLDWSEHWWSKTSNPLHIWRVCLNSDPPLSIPEWCLPYLAKSAGNIEELMSGRDFRGDRPKVSPSDAHALIPEALEFSRQGKKSAFTEIADSSSLQRRAMDAAWGGARAHDAVEAIKKERSITDDRARRLLAKGKRLARLR